MFNFYDFGDYILLIDKGQKYDSDMKCCIVTNTVYVQSRTFQFRTSKVSEFCDMLHKIILCAIQIPDQQYSRFMAQLTVL